MHELTALHAHGLFLRREALDFGYRDEDLRDAIRAGVLHRVRQGAYVGRTTWLGFSPEEQFRLRGLAVSLTHSGRVALSHTSAAAEHGLSLWREDLTRVHVTRLDGGTGRRTHDVVYHESTWTDRDLRTQGELVVMGPERSALEAASLSTVEGGLVICDSLLHHRLGSPDSLWAAYERDLRGDPFAAKLQMTLRLTRPGAQSPGETRSRYLCFCQHLPPPELQYAVYNSSGRLVGITDFAWPERKVLGEFDGLVKYLRDLRGGETPSDVVTREKRREDLLREATGWGMVRLIWTDLDQPRATGARIARMLGLAIAA